MDIAAEAWARSQSGSIPYSLSCDIGEPTGTGYIPADDHARHDPSYVAQQYVLNSDTIFTINCKNEDDTVEIGSQITVLVFPPE